MSSVVYYPGYSQVQVTENLIWQVISMISQSNPMTVTTSGNSNYVPGMLVRFMIPQQFGMQQLNSIQAQVIGVSGTSVNLDVDSTGFEPFAYPSLLPSAYTPPTMIPNASGPYLLSLPLPYANQNSFEGTIYNAGLPI